MRRVRCRSRRRRFGHIEPLETRRLLAVDVVQPFQNLSANAGAASAVIDLDAAFDLAGVTGTVVRFANNVGADIYAELFDAAGPGRTRTTPLTAANFLAYLDAGRYTDSIMHRSVPGFVVQGGGFTDKSLAAAIPQFPAVSNEPGNTNIRGTIAMAKLGGNPNSATNQFFFNLADNSANLDAQNGGFTAFARVLGTGMTVVDAMAALPRFDFGSPFDELPAKDVTTQAAVTRSNLVTISSVNRANELVFTASSSNPAVATTSVGPNGSLTVDYGDTGSGTSTITVRAASVFNPADFTERQFTVTLNDATPNPNPKVLVAGSDVGAASQPWVTVIDAATAAVVTRFLAYEEGFGGGVRVTLGDVTGDRVDEIITAAGPGRVGEIRVFSQNGIELVNYRTLPFGPGYRGGVEVAAGDIDGDRIADIVAGGSRGDGLVNVFIVSPNAADPVPNRPDRSVRTMPVGFIGGVTVTTADIGTYSGGRVVNAATPDGRTEVVVGSGPGIAPRVLVYDMSAAPTVVRRITPFSPAMLGGVSVAAGRYDNDGHDDIIIASGRRGGSQLEVCSGRVAATVLVRRAAFASLVASSLPTYAVGLDSEGDGRIDALVASQGSGPGVGIRRLPGTGVGTAFSSLGGPLRLVATRPSVS
ncbi:MAG: peptidylprolyl isomerase [Planctomycetota bacterium]